MIDPVLALTLLIVDFPRPDRCSAADWECTILSALAARSRTGGNVAMVATLPELLPEAVAARLMAGGVVPLNGLTEALAAVEAAMRRDPTDLALDLVLPGVARDCVTLTEAQAKAALAAHGLAIPQSRRAADGAATATMAAELQPPYVLKGEGIAHKSEAGAVVLNLRTPADVAQAAGLIQADSFLVEEMIDGAVAELLVGIIRDPAHGFVLTLAAGGVLTELLADSTSLLVPASERSIKQALTKLKCAKLLTGFRGRPAADMPSLIAAIVSIQGFAIAQATTLDEVEVNPLLCTPTRAVAADALIRRAR